MAQTKFDDFELLKKGSVKDIYRDLKNDEQLAFKFSDRYSVYDWGEMPDTIENKGWALGLMGEVYFEILGSKKFWRSFSDKFSKELGPSVRDVLNELCERGLKTHFKEFYDPYFVVQQVEVVSPKFDQTKNQWDYSNFYKRDKSKFHLVPLECIFRFGLPKGSSFFKRAGDQNYLKTLGVEKSVHEGQWLSRPIVEVSTKLESRDRYLKDSDEIKRISDLTDVQLDKLKALTSLCSLGLKWIFNQSGIQLWDGKFEWAIALNSEGLEEFMLVDSIGPDELRLSYEGVQLSKEVLRQFYSNSSWARAVEKAKKIADERSDPDWKKIVLEQMSETPGRLDENYKMTVEGMYQSLCYEAVKVAEKFGFEMHPKPHWGSIPSLSKVVRSLESLKS